jgi:predicted DNA binding protein
MRTITLEFRTEDLIAIGLVPARLFEKYESAELLETLRLERGWRLQLVKLRRRGALRSVAELNRESRQIRREYGLESFEVVEERQRTHELILLVRQRNPPALARIVARAGGEVSPTAPFRFDALRTLASFHGAPAALRKVLALLRREGLPFRMVRSGARPLPSGPAGRELTARQRAVLARAWALGFFAVPRRITLTRFASLTGQSVPALGKMLRRAEGTLVARYLASELATTATPES